MLRITIHDSSAGTTLQLQALADAGRKDVPERIAALQRWLIEEQRELRAFIRQLEPGAERPGLPERRTNPALGGAATFERRS